MPLCRPQGTFVVPAEAPTQGRPGSTVDTGLQGRTAIVTGAAQGIGQACARALAAEGAQVVCADLNVDGAVLAAAELGGVGVGVDVREPESCDALVREAVERFGGVDVLVTCAGVFHATPLDRITAEEVAAIVVVLASDAASYVHGAHVDVNGGLLMD